MAADRILINVAPGETRIAFLSGSRLCQMTIIREGAENIAGNIYLGRVEAVVDGLQAAFINIGLARSGFLALADARPHGHDDVHDIANYVAEGDAVTVQVLRDPAEDKGAKLTTRIGLTGRDIVYRPGQPGIFVSRRIDEEVERRRLTTLVEAMADDEEGFILRTAAAEADEDDLARDVNRLRGLWGAIQDQRDQAKAPHCLYSETEPLFAFLRDHGGGNLEAVTADNTETVFQLRSFAEDEMPEIVNRIRAHTSRYPLFDTDDIEAMIDAALDPLVPLASGGDLIISETPALTAIDVNTGGGKERTTLELNQEAAEEIARQIQLRNLSGLLVVDFVSMKRDEDRQAALDTLRRALADDPLQSNVFGFTRLGLVELTRRRLGPSLAGIMSDGLPMIVKSAHTVALEALRQVLKEAATTAAAEYILRAAPDVITALDGPAAAARRTLEARLGVAIELESGSDCRQESYHVRAGRGGDGG